MKIVNVKNKIVDLDTPIMQEVKTREDLNTLGILAHLKEEEIEETRDELFELIKDYKGIEKVEEVEEDI